MNINNIVYTAGVLFSLLTVIQQINARRGGDKFILGNQGPGCGPKFIFKSGSRKHKEWFILNECRDLHKHHDHHDHHHHEPHVLNFPIHVPPTQHHIHQAPPMLFNPGYLPYQHSNSHSPHHYQHSSLGHSLFPYESPRSERGSGSLNNSPSGYSKYSRQPVIANYDSLKNQHNNGGSSFSNDNDQENDFDNMNLDEDNSLAATEENSVMPTSATLRQINDWNAYNHNQIMALRRRRNNMRYDMMPPSSSVASSSWRKLQNKRFINFHDKQF